MASVNLTPSLSGLGAARAVEAMLRSLGGTRVALRMPVAADSSPKTGLGLAQSAWEEVVLEPVLLHMTLTRPQHFELIVGAETLRVVMGAASEEAAAEVMSRAGRVRCGESVFRIAEVKPEFMAGRLSLYKLRLEA